MFDAIQATIKAAANGLAAQSVRMRIASENLANAQSTGETAGADPYQRKLISFKGALDEATGADVVLVDRITRDAAPFKTEYKPGHPAADSNGYVKLPNVDMLVETADMREAARSYSANLQVIKQAREMMSMTLDLLKVSS
jgi:flagellar basal-body rod protein FlgC